MSINDSSALILIVGAIAVLGFVIHGLWFSGRSINRKLKKNNQTDQEIVKSDGIGKVRIVTTEKNSSGGASIETFNVQSKQEQKQKEKSAEQKTGAEEKETPADNALPELADTYELNLVADPEKPYLGDEIKEICDKNGFLRGDSDIFYVYENPYKRENVVFRICSLKEPFSFPKDLSAYETPMLAVYMNLPARGKAYAYFKAMRMAADIFIDTLGGEIQDNDYHPLDKETLDRISTRLKQYDEEEAEADNPQPQA